MSDVQQGPGWWLASDGKWYPPQAPQPPASAAGTVATYGEAAGPAAVPTAAWPVLGGAALLFIGALLPWATITAPFVGQISKGGLEGDGVLTLLAALVIGALAIPLFTKRQASRRIGIGIVVVSALAAVVGIIDIVDISSRFDDVDALASASPGIGLYLTVVGAIAGVVGGVMAITARRA